MKLCATEIYWDRIWLVFRLEAADGETLPLMREGQLRDREGRLGAILRVSENGRELRLNVTNAGDCRCVQPGLYRLAACTEEKDEEPLPVYLAEDAREIWKAAKKSFSYGKQGGRYSIIPAIGKDGKILLRIGDRGETPAGGPLRRAYRTAMRRYLQHSYRSYHMLRFRRKKRILLLSEQSDTLGDNLQALKAGLLERGLDQKYDIHESCRITVTKKHLGFRSWRSVIKEIAAADVIFLDDHAPLLDWLQLAKNTKVVQLWHGGIGFKASGYSRWGHDGSLPPDSGYRQLTFGVCTSEKNRDIYAEIWGVNPGMVLPAGMPRLDALLEPGSEEKARQETEACFPGTAGRRIILYAPTYRGNSRLDASFPYQQIDWQTIYEDCGEECVVLVKMHPWVREAPPIPEEYRDRIFDAGARETAELLLAADILITDYSSIIFEFALRRKPMLFYAFDLEEYQQSRGFHGNYEDMVPGKMVCTIQELSEAVRTKDFGEDRAEAYRARHFSPPYTGNTARVIDWILEDHMPRDVQEALEESRKTAARIGRKNGKGSGK